MKTYPKHLLNSATKFSAYQVRNEMIRTC